MLFLNLLKPTEHTNTHNNTNSILQPLPEFLIKIKLTEEGRANYTLLIKKSTQPNKICINIHFID